MGLSGERGKPGNALATGTAVLSGVTGAGCPQGSKGKAPRRRPDPRVGPRGGSERPMAASGRSRFRLDDSPCFRDLLTAVLGGQERCFGGTYSVEP